MAGRQGGGFEVGVAFHFGGGGKRQRGVFGGILRRLADQAKALLGFPQERDIEEEEVREPPVATREVVRETPAVDGRVQCPNCGFWFNPQKGQIPIEPVIRPAPADDDDLDPKPVADEVEEPFVSEVAVAPVVPPDEPYGALPEEDQDLLLSPPADELAKVDSAEDGLSELERMVEGEWESLQSSLEEIDGITETACDDLLSDGCLEGSDLTDASDNAAHDADGAQGSESAQSGTDSESGTSSGQGGDGGADGSASSGDASGGGEGGGSNGSK